MTLTDLSRIASRTSSTFRAVALALSLALVVAVGSSACSSAVSPGAPCLQSGGTIYIAPPHDESLDLLFVIDNSGTMLTRIAMLTNTMTGLLNALTRPPDMNMDGRPDWAPVRDLHVGVVTTDLGTPGFPVPGCASSDVGDDGVLHPLERGNASTQWMHRTPPWRSGTTPCPAARSLPTFLSYDSTTSSPAQLATDFACMTDFHASGCGLEQPLESAYRALVTHRADDRVDNTGPNAGFLRERATLAIIVLSDEDDGSVRDCRYAEPGVPCSDAIDVFSVNATRWAAESLNLRMYLGTACGPQDPTWSLDRYVDPHDPGRGFLSLKPGHPERVVFVALTGVPTRIPERTVGIGRAVDWDALLGAPDSRDPENFCGRVGASAWDDPSAEGGAVTMRPGVRDPSCPDRVLPACRGASTMPDPTRAPCLPIEQPFAWPARRLAEIARRLDESPLCYGAPCRNGSVVSICNGDPRAILRPLVDRLADDRLRPCFPRNLPTATSPDGGTLANCVALESLPAGEPCDASRGRRRATDERGRNRVDESDPSRVVCEVAQLPTVDRRSLHADGPARFYDRAPSAAREGFYYLEGPRPDEPNCSRRVAFTPRGAAPTGSWITMQCVDRVAGACP